MSNTVGCQPAFFPGQTVARTVLRERRVHVLPFSQSPREISEPGCVRHAGVNVNMGGGGQEDGGPLVVFEAGVRQQDDGVRWFPESR